MVKYDKSTIYKICCKDVNIKGEYVGSTTNLQRRKTSHKFNCNNMNSTNYSNYVYSYIRENGGWENFDVVEVEKFNATDKNHLHTRERYWIEFLRSELNSYIPLQNSKEYYENNKESILTKHKEYYELNKKQLCENKKIYNELNKEHNNEIKKIYRNANRDQLREKRKEKIKCECGSETSKSNLSYHKKTKKHLSYIQSLNIT
jgi:hypothetical protein